MELQSFLSEYVPSLSEPVAQLLGTESALTLQTTETWLRSEEAKTALAPALERMNLPYETQESFLQSTSSWLLAMLYRVYLSDYRRLESDPPVQHSTSDDDQSDKE